jgi:glycosidase
MQFARARRERGRRWGFYKKLFATRPREPVLTSGELIWINNTEPASVLSFLRKKGNDEVLVIQNLSNRQLHVTIDRSPRYGLFVGAEP